jgi:hypothetical protein
MAVELSAAEIKRRAQFKRLKGRFFPANNFSHSQIYSHPDQPRMPITTLPKEGHLPLRSDKPFATLAGRTRIKPSPNR